MSSVPPTPRWRGILRAGWQNRGLNLWDFVVEVWQRFSEDRIFVAAGAIAFFTILSLIPLLLLAVSLASSVYLLSSKEHALAEIARLTTDMLGPQIAVSVQKQILSVVSHAKILVGLSLVVGFWTGSQIFLILETAMNLVWHCPKRRPFWLSRGVALLMVVIVGTLMLAAILLTNMLRIVDGMPIPVLGHPIDQISPWIKHVGGWLVSGLAPVLFVSSIFAVIYRLLPTKAVTFRSVIPGALFGGILWTISVHIFGWYTISSKDHFFMLYDTLSGTVLLMLWFYYSAVIMLVGAEISATYHRRLVEAGNEQERVVEEKERALEARHERQDYRQRLACAVESTAYYGYRPPPC
ncbi:MAG: YihY/virulence factor BrkB family protein [Armatimonadota bacterium]